MKLFFECFAHFGEVVEILGDYAFGNLEVNHILRRYVQTVGGILHS